MVERQTVRFTQSAQTGGLKERTKAGETLRAKREDAEKALTPKKSIKKYCLLVCDKKKRKNSKRDVIKCPEWRCPLYPYRTGIQQNSVRIYGENAKRERIRDLEIARHNVEIAQNKLNEELFKTEAMRSEREIKGKEKRKRMEEAIERQMKDYKLQTIDMLQRREKHVAEAEENLLRKKERVRKLEELHDRELELGMWGDPEDIEINEKESE